MSWSVIYLLIAIGCFIVAIWRLARRANIFLVMIGVVWFFTLFFKIYLPSVYRFVLIQGVPSIGALLHYVVLPVFIILALISIKSRS
jgi:hypothetical protein